MIHRGNYQIVQDYLAYRQRILQNDPKTLRVCFSCLKHLLQWADETPLHHAAQIENTFPEYVSTARNDGHSEQLSPVRMDRIVSYAREMLTWAKREHPGKFRTLSDSWINSLRVRRGIGIQSHLQERKYYTLDEVRALLAVRTPDEYTLRFKRDKAALAFLYLSGLRAAAFASLPIQAVDLPRKRVMQLPELGVQTKNSKAAITHLFPIPDLLQIVSAWDAFLRAQSADPRLHWYTRLEQVGLRVNAADLIIERGHYPKGRIQALNTGIADLCRLAGVEYKSAHKLRHGHGVFGIKHARTMAELKALSQNMMHSTVAITDGTYGNLVDDDVADIIGTFSEAPLP